MDHRPSLPAVVSVLTVLAVALVGCDPGDPVEVDDPDLTLPDPQPEGGTLIAAISGEPDTLDPHHTTAYPSFQVLENVYDTLVEPGLDLTFEPALATDWAISDDQLTWTFELRDNAVFHNARPFVADDVVFSYERIMEEGANAFRFDSVEEVVATGDHEVEMRLSRPTPNLLANIGSFKGMAIIPRELVDDGDPATEAIGTGPFRLQSVRAGTVVLERSPDYWREGPYVERVELRSIPDPTVALTNLRAREVHWADSVPPQDLDALLDDPEITVEAVSGGDYWYLAVNQDREPFDDVRVRRALAYAIDRDAVTEAAMFDAATPTQTAIPRDSFWATDYAPFEHDPDEARRLLDEAGVEDLEVDFMLTTEFPETIQAGQVVVSQLAEVGVTAEIRTLDFSAWLAEQGDGTWDMFVLGWLGNIDPDDFYYAQHHSDGGFNFQGYANPDVDALLDEARAETDRDRRKGLYDEAVRMIVDDVSYLYLYNPDVVNAWDPQVEGYTTRPDSAIRFREVRLVER